MVYPTCKDYEKNEGLPQNTILPKNDWYIKNTNEDFYDRCECEQLDCYQYELEQCFPLDNDPHLPDTELCAVTNVQNNPIRKGQMRIGSKREPVLIGTSLKLQKININKKRRELKERYRHIDKRLKLIRQFGGAGEKEWNSPVQQKLVKEKIRLRDKIVDLTHKDQHKGYIDCVHTGVKTTEDIKQIPQKEWDWSGLKRGDRLKLDPIEHFRALRSWAHSIVEYGIENIIKASINEESLDLPFGFNWEMQSQFIYAIKSVNPKVAEFLAVDVLMDIYKRIKESDVVDFKWTQQRDEMLEHYFIGCVTDVEILKKCKEMFDEKSDYYKYSAYKTEILPQAASVPNKEIQEFIYNELVQGGDAPYIDDVWEDTIIELSKWDYLPSYKMEDIAKRFLLDKDPDWFAWDSLRKRLLKRFIKMFKFSSKPSSKELVEKLIDLKERVENE